MKALCCLVALCLPLLSQAQRVKEVFEVGPQVYVRALTPEPARQALWVVARCSSGKKRADCLLIPCVFPVCRTFRGPLCLHP